MKQYLLSILLLTCLTKPCLGQISVGSSGIYIADSTKISVRDDLYLNGEVTGKGQLILNANHTQKLNANNQSVSFLKINNPQGVSLNSSISIVDSLYLGAGNFDLQEHIVTLEPLSWLVEDELSQIQANGGYFESIRDLSAMQDSNIAGLGLFASQNVPIGFSVIRRGHTPQSWQSESSIPRYYEFISPGIDSLNNLSLYFPTIELNANPNSDWILMRSANSGNSWETVENISSNDNKIPVNLSATSYRWTLFPQTIQLPVEWISVEAFWEEEASQINWTTKEENVSYYYVQRSIDGRTFGDIGELMAQSNQSQNNSYQYRDISARALGLGQLYYRIRQIDQDGQSSMSKIMTVKVPQAKHFLMVMVTPNPVQETLYYQYQSSGEDRPQLQLSTTLGKVLHNQSLDPSIGQRKKGQINVNQLSAGYYFLRLSDEHGVSTFKFVKE